MKILIITNAFPPLNVIASLRPYSWAKYWSRMGHEICVLTTEKTSSSGWLNLDMDPDVAARIRVEAVPFFIFRRRKNGGTGGQTGVQPPGAAFQFFRKVVRWLRMNVFGSFLDSRMFWIVPAIHRALEIYKSWKFDLIVSTYDPPAAHIIAARLNRSLKVPWAADYRDLWAGSHLEKPIFPLDFLERKLEDITVVSAFQLSTVSNPLCEQLQNRFKKPVIRIENGFDEDDFFHAAKPPENQTHKCLQIVYTGKIYQKNQDPSPLFEALVALSKEGKLSPEKVAVHFFGLWLDPIDELIREYDVAEYVKNMGFLDHKSILRVQKCADLLLFLDFQSSGKDGVLTGKIFEYMAAGRPVLGIGMDEGKAAAKLIHEAGIGVTFGRDPQKIADFLEGFLAGKPVPYRPDMEVIQRYTRRRLAEKLLHEIQSNLPQGGR